MRLRWQDALAFAWSAGPWTRLFVAMFAFASVFYIAQGRAFGLWTEPFALFSLALSGGFAIAQLVVLPRRMMDAQEALGWSHIEFTDEGFATVTPKGRIVRRWADMKKIIEKRDHFFLILNKNSGICLPKRAFGSNSGFAEVRGLMIASGKLAA